jgi:prophage antirepressor-like protein
MSPEPVPPSSSFEEAARRVEAELRRWLASFNDEVLPSLRRDGSAALRAAAGKLAQLADALVRSQPRQP